MLTDTERGLVAGILMSEGSFGGDGKQPHVMLRKHVRHESLMRWLVDRFPRSRLYGPYHHADRSYFQWVARGVALVEDVLPVLDELVVARARRPRGRAPAGDARALRALHRAHPRAGAGGVSARSRKRLAVLTERFELPESAAPALDALLELLASDPTAPTTVTDPATAVDAHVADALVALELDAVRGARRIADLGLGRGLSRAGARRPRSPTAQVCARREQLEEVRVPGRAAVGDGPRERRGRRVASRAVEGRGIGACDLVTARALAPLNVLVEYAAPLLADGGSLVAWKGRRDAAEEARRRRRGRGHRPGGRSRCAPSRPWDGAEHLHLHALRSKVGSTPNRYPRRPGMARKRPLRASV